MLNESITSGRQPTVLSTIPVSSAVQNTFKLSKIAARYDKADASFNEFLALATLLLNALIANTT